MNKINVQNETHTKIAQLMKKKIQIKNLRMGKEIEQKTN